MKTCYPSKEQIVQSWRLLDAEGMILGRLATQVSSILRGKDKPIYTPALDTGDYVVVVNAEKVTVTGNKLQDKVYYRHSQYPGGLKATTLENLKAKKPEEVIKKAVWGMLPKGRLGRKMFKKLKVYAGDTHPHESQISGNSVKAGER